MRYIFDECLARLKKREPSLPFSAEQTGYTKNKLPLTFVSTGKEARGIRPYVPSFPGKRGPRTTYSELINGDSFRDLRIVGIDLTGSEKRASGWSSLIGNQASTQRLNTDLELFVETLNVCPDLVSIDSPLSMPKGRTRVTDDDPVRDEFGIVRACEHVLFARGVNVYPSLIPSMQQLTARGIRLAAKFREAGIPVIESYPGAAQDIMAIPRKRAGLAYLKKGLNDFGIEGGFIERDVSHDELDAITSAVVGLFFWSGKYEALGNEDEDYLIIPDLNTSPNSWRERKVVGFSGPIAAGKTTAARHLESQGYAYARYSETLARMLKANDVPVNRDTLQEIGERVHVDPGQRWLSKQLVQPLDDQTLIAIDGIRFPEDHAFMVEKFGPGFRHIHIVASYVTRKQRYSGLATEFDRASNHDVEGKVLRVGQIADTSVDNDEDASRFTSRITKAIT